MCFSENDTFKHSKILKFLSEKQIDFLSKLLFKVSPHLPFAKRRKTKAYTRIKFYL